jgi:hypothetical protein
MASEVAALHFSDVQPVLTNVRFWGQSGRASNEPLCRLMTQSGHSGAGRCLLMSVQLLV